MNLTVNNEKSAEIEDTVVEQILNMYPEEKLITRSVFLNAFINKTIEYKDLKTESEKVLIPWQMFLLNKQNFKKEMNHIEEMRADKVSPKLMGKRKGRGSVTSKRIIDRLIRLQNFITSTNIIPRNTFCGSLIGKPNEIAVSYIISYFDIDFEKFRNYKNKSTALQYLLGKIEDKYINISHGVLANKMLPHPRVVNSSIYKNTSGFVIKDDYVPFIFLPGEANPEEVEGRQIYTLMYLVILIGLNEYDFFLGKDFKTKLFTATKKERKIYAITSELLLPSDVTELLRGTTITSAIRDNLALKYKITPTAVVVTLRIRKIITTKSEYEALLPPPYDPDNAPKRYLRTPKIESSVRKFCGKYPYDFVNGRIRNGQLTSIRAQYLLFGIPNKKNFKNYRDNLKI